MNVAFDTPRSSFADRVLQLLERVEHRIARAPAEREQVFRLRFDAYQRIGFLSAGVQDRLYDPRYDDDPNAWITTTFLDGELAGTVRVNFAAGPAQNLPGLQAFADILTPKLWAGQTMVEFTRLAAEISLSASHPELAYLIMRPAYLAARHFDPDFAVASPRAEHIAFYRRIFGAELWCPPRDYPGLTAKLSCMGSDYRAARRLIEARHPFYTSTPAAREALFGPENRLSPIQSGRRAEADEVG